MSLKAIGAWALRRLKEKSTYVGLATVATALGFPGVAEALGQAGQMALVIFGSGLLAASTIPRELKF